MDERELQEQGLGVDAGDSTESAQQATAPVDAQPTAQPRINLDESPEFRRWKSEYDRKLSQTEQRYNQMLAQREAELERVRVAEMDDYQLKDYEIQKRDQQLAYYAQRLEQMEAEQAKMRVLREVSAEMGVPVEEILDAQDVADAWRLAAIKAKELTKKQQQERKAEEDRRVAERAGKAIANRVDTGSGAPPRSATWSEEAARAFKDGDVAKYMRLLRENKG